MNNACPNCGAVYAVAEKDIGRKLKCKKCGSGLIVSEDGLVENTPAAAAAPPPPSKKSQDEEETENDFAADEEEDEAPRKGKKGKKATIREPREPGPGLGEQLKKVGGLPTILFSFGIFLVIWFYFMTGIGDAAAQRDSARPQKLELERQARIQEKLPKGKTLGTLSADESKKLSEDTKKIDEEYAPMIEEAKIDAEMAVLNNIRSLWFDRYGTMFGFFFVAFGCIGYLRTEQHIVVKIVAGAILTLMMLFVFGSISGGCGGRSSTPLPPSRVGVKGAM